MPFFSYKARDHQGRVFKGLVEANSELAAKDILEEHGYEIFFLRLTAKRQLFFTKLPFLGRVSDKDLMILSRRFSILVTSNLPMVGVLQTLSRQTQNQRLKMVLSKVADKVEGGARLSEALAEFPDIFDSFYINLVRTGERVGKLDEVLEYLADQKEREYDLYSKIRSMLIYPSFIFVMLVAIIIFMMAFVVPKMMVILQEANVELPLSTRIIIAVSNFFAAYWWLLCIFIFLFGLAFYFLIKTTKGKNWWDQLKLKIPILSGVLNDIYIVRFTTSLSILLKGGVDIVNSLETVADSMSNTVYKKLVFKTAKEVANGSPIAAVLAEEIVIPYMVTEMIDIGERTGRVDKVLENIAVFYSREVNNSINNLVSLIEPLVIILMGAGVALVVAAMILPMYRLAGSV
ncbi:MAG: type II secretion system F family protein [Patescibacteria group bacterium]